MVQWGNGAIFPLAFKNSNYFIVPMESFGAGSYPVFYRTFLHSKKTTSIQFVKDELICVWSGNSVYTAQRSVSSAAWLAIGGLDG